MTTIVNLPTEIQTKILGSIAWEDHIGAMEVCKLWRDLFQTKFLQKRRYLFDSIWFNNSPVQSAAFSFHPILVFTGLHAIIELGQVKRILWKRHGADPALNITTCPVIHDNVFYPFPTDEKGQSILGTTKEQCTTWLWVTEYNKVISRWRSLNSMQSYPMLEMDKDNLTIKEFIDWTTDLVLLFDSNLKNDGALKFTFQVNAREGKYGLNVVVYPSTPFNPNFIWK